MKVETLTKKILETLIGLTATSADLFVTIIEAGHGASYGQLQRKLREVQERSSSYESRDLIKKKKTFYSMLYQLHKDGLVKNKKGKWAITRAGREKYKKILNRLPIKKYEKEIDSTLKIVIFDIPEKQRSKRFWLRDRLRELGFRMLQKSVWTGKAKVPEEFIEDLRNLGLLNYVEIFAVTKAGSLRSLG